MKSLINFKVRFVLLGTFAIPAIVFAGITQTQLPVETSIKAFDRETKLERDEVLESRVGSQRSMQNLSSLNVMDRPVDDVQLVRFCNKKVSSCPIP